MIAIGIDGGGTKTRLLIQRGASTPEYFEYDQTIRFLEVGYDTAAHKLVQLFERSSVELADIRSIAIGLAGAGLEHEQREFEQTLLELLPSAYATVAVQSDSTLSLSAAFPNAGMGLIAIAGTGSVAIGRTEEGSVVRVGGWGRTIGDEGSGHAIGLAALRHFARVFDGRDTPGDLFKALSRTLESSYSLDPREIRTLLASNKLVASDFAKLVFDHPNDRYASEMLHDAAEDLTELITTCAGLIHYRGEVKVIGSVISNDWMLSSINDRIGQSGLSVSVLDPTAAVKHALFIAQRTMPTDDKQATRLIA